MAPPTHWPDALTRLFEVPRISIAFVVTVVVNAFAIAVLAKYFSVGLAIPSFVDALRLGFMYAFVLTVVVHLPGSLLLRLLKLEGLWHFVIALGLACALLVFLLLVLWRQGGPLIGAASILPISGAFVLGAVSGASFWLVAYAGSNRPMQPTPGSGG